jgi:hypothetical protein
LAEFLFQEAIDFRGKRYRQILIARREILGQNQGFPNGMTVLGQILEETSHTDYGSPAGSFGERMIVFREVSKPANNMRIALDLGRRVNLWIVSVEVSQKAIDLGPVVFNGCRLQGGGHDLELFLKDSIEFANLRCAHRSSGSWG